MKLNNKRILVLQHAEIENLGIISDILIQLGFEYKYLRADLGQPIPLTLDGYQGLILMGGPQSVYEENYYQYLKSEKILVNHAIENDFPILGICLGSQLLAEALGSRVYPGNAFELGWKRVTLSSEMANDPVLGHLPEIITPLHWHGDIYDLPVGATPIGSSELTAVQGFVWKQKIYAILFHFEMSFPQIMAMVKAFPDDLKRSGITRDMVIAQTTKHLNVLHTHALETFRRWAVLVSNDRAQSVNPAQNRIWV